MKSIKALIKRHPLLSYFALAFGISCGMSLYGAALFGILFAISVGMLIWYFRGLKE